jgi:hypothetical protein
MYAPWKLLITKKEALKQEEENPKWQEHTLLLSLAAMDLQNGKGSSREARGSYLYVNRWSPPAKRRIIRCLTTPNIAVEPRNPDNAPTLYTDAPSDHPVLKTPHSERYCMIWIQPSDELLSPLSKCQFLRCWSSCLGTSLYDLNATIGWTDGQGVGSSGA